MKVLFTTKKLGLFVNNRGEVRNSTKFEW